MVSIPLKTFKKKDSEEAITFLALSATPSKLGISVEDIFTEIAKEYPTLIEVIVLHRGVLKEYKDGYKLVSKYKRTHNKEPV